MNRLRIGAAVVVLAVVSTAPGAGASAVATADRITNRETVQAELNPDGSVKVARLFSQLVIDGNGQVRVVDPTATKNIRDLDGFAKPKTEDGAAIWTVDVSGRAVRRTVADFPKDHLPVDVSVSYLLNGKVVKARDVVGKSGTLTVTYHLKNMTEEPTEVTYTDGRGTQQTAVVQVPTPYVGQLQTTVPGRFDSLDAPRADVAGDGRGGNLLTWTMVLFAPIGEIEQEFGWTAHIRNGVVPKATVQIVPVPPKRKPELKFGEDGFSNGAAQATELTAGAGEIDANLLELRDGAATLLDGLSQLASGASDLKAGLAGEAAPGAAQLAGGLDDADAGGADLASGLGDLDDGAGLVSGGAADLSDGLHLISAGLADLAAVDGLPAARAGAIALQSGVAAILAGIGSAATPGTIRGGLAAIGGGLTALESASTGLPAAKGGVDAVNAGLAAAKTALQGLQAAVGGSIAEISGVSATLGCPGSLNPVCPLLDSALNSSHGLSTVTLPGLAALEAGTDTAIAGLGAVSAGLATAVAGVSALSAGTTAVTAGVGAVKLGLDNPGGLGVVQGLDALVAGLTTAVDGVTALNDGAADAASGADDLASGAADLAAGATTAADGADDLRDGLDLLKAGAHDLSSGLTDAADGAGQLADGLDQAKGGGQQVTDGAGQLSKEGTSVLEAKGNDAAADAALSYARLAKLDEKAEAGGLPYGAPAGGEGSAAYLLTVTAADAQGTEDAGRAALAIGLLVVASAAGALVRRRFSAAG